MRAVILISTCREYERNGFNQAIRDTWLRSKLIPTFFLFGRGEGSLPEDGISIACHDDYWSLCYKTREGHRWALEQGYDQIFQAFADTFIVPRLLLETAGDDYRGHFPSENLRTGEIATLGCYASGGPGYWLSKRASELILDQEPDHWAEDLWVGRIMKKFGIAGVHDERFLFRGGYERGCVTSHLSRGPGNYSPDWMRRTYSQYLKVGGFRDES